MNRLVIGSDATCRNLQSLMHPPELVWSSVDPGLVCDLATWFEDHLRALNRLTLGDMICDGLGFIVIERVDARPGDPRPKDIVELNRAVYYLAGSARCPLVTYTPQEWGGNLPKPVKHDALWEILTPEERALFPTDTGARIAAALERGSRARWRKKNGKPMSTSDYYGKGEGSEVHNALDAAAIGAVHGGRLVLK